MPETFTLKDLTEIISKTLDLRENDGIEILRNRLAPNELKIVRIPQEPAK